MLLLVVMIVVVGVVACGCGFVHCWRCCRCAMPLLFVGGCCSSWLLPWLLELVCLLFVVNVVG